MRTPVSALIVFALYSASIPLVFAATSGALCYGGFADGDCEPGENIGCPDCGGSPPPPAPFCGDHQCDWSVSYQEDCSTCTTDCGVCPQPCAKNDNFCNMQASCDERIAASPLYDPNSCCSPIHELDDSSTGTCCQIGLVIEPTSGVCCLPGQITYFSGPNNEPRCSFLDSDYPSWSNTPTVTTSYADYITIQFTGASDPTSGVQYYSVYRDDVLLGKTKLTQFNDYSVAPSTVYTYKIEAADYADHFTNTSPVNLSTGSHASNSPSIKKFGKYITSISTATAASGAFQYTIYTSQPTICSFNRFDRFLPPFTFQQLNIGSEITPIAPYLQQQSVMNSFSIASGKGAYALQPVCQLSCGINGCGGTEVAGDPATNPNPNVCAKDCGCGSGKYYNAELDQCLAQCPAVTDTFGNGFLNQGCVADSLFTSPTGDQATNLSLTYGCPTGQTCAGCPAGYYTGPNGLCNDFVTGDGFCASGHKRQEIRQPTPGASPDCCPDGESVGECTGTQTNSCQVYDTKTATTVTVTYTCGQAAPYGVTPPQGCWPIEYIQTCPQ